MEKNNESVEKAKEKKIQLNKDKFLKVLDIFDSLLKENTLFILPAVPGYKIGFNKELTKDFYPELETQDVIDVVRFIARYYHFVNFHDFELFYKIFEGDEEIQLAKELVELIKTHKNTKLIIYRHARRYNFPITDIEIQKKTFQFDNIQINYFDIIIPYVNDQGEEETIRFEIDHIELENFIASLNKPLEDQK